MKLRPLPAEETEGVMYYDPAATGERIQTLRKNREVTQEQFAVDLNISDRYMRNCERIAAQNGVGAATVKRAEKHAKGVDAAAEDAVPGAREDRIHGIPHQWCSGNRVPTAPHYRTRTVRVGTGTAAGTHL